MKPFYLQGRWETSAESQAVINPWNGDKLADICLADAAQVEQAVASSHEAFQKTRLQPAWERSKILTKIADLISDRHARVCGCRGRRGGASP